jgi:multiple sugar transport system ATP-binding protein
MSITLIIEKLSKTFGKEVAIEDISFQVEPGELFALLGPSGAGKSTTINCIAGLVKPDKGEINADGESVLETKPQFRDFSMVFESYALYPHLTVAENIAFPLKAPVRSGGISEEEKIKRVQETAQMLEIPELLNRFPKELSGGQKQRVGLGRALVRRPRLFLLDEPIAHLDAKLRHHMRGELKKLIKELGITTLLATPDYNEVIMRWLQWQRGPSYSIRVIWSSLERLLSYIIIPIMRLWLNRSVIPPSIFWIVE